MSRRAFPHRPGGAASSPSKAEPKPTTSPGQLAREFSGGATMLTLTRKYGLTPLAVQAMLREAARKGRA